MAGAERGVSAVFEGNHIYWSWSSLTFRITVSCDTRHWIGCFGFSSFLSKIKVFQKCLAYDTIKKIWIIPHKAVMSF